MSRDLVLGLDGGGSKTVVALADRDGAVVALRRGPGLDPYGNARWRQDLARLVADVGTGEGRLDRAVLGLSCHAESAATSADQTACARRLFAVPVDTLNDVHVAFEGALAGGAGVLALAGTGSMAWAGDGPGLRIAFPRVRGGGTQSPDPTTRSPGESGRCRRVQSSLAAPSISL